MVLKYELRYTCAAQDIKSNDFTTRSLIKMTFALNYAARNNKGIEILVPGETRAWKIESGCRMSLIPVEEPYNKNFRIILGAESKIKLITLGKNVGLWNGGNGSGKL